MNKLTRSGQSFLDFKKKSTAEEFPKAFTDYIKSFGEIYFWEKGNFHVVTKAQHAREVLSSVAFSADRGSFFISRMPNMDLSLIGDFFGVVKKMMVMSDDDKHLEMRKASTGGMDEQVLKRFSFKIKETVKELVEYVRGHSSFDFSENISKKLPSIVLADLFSIPECDRGNFLEWSNIMTGFFGGASQYRNEDGVEVNHAAKELKNYFSELIKSRRVQSGNDYVSEVLGMQVKCNLSDDEVISQLIMMLVAGMATTTDQINNSMFILANNPKIQMDLKNNLSLIPGFLEECKRLDPAVTFIFRVARTHTTIGEQPILPGEVVFISTHAINRDLPEAQRPDELDIYRRGSHFAYGFGPHYCLGAKLARLEMQALFEEILRGLPSFSIDQNFPSERDHYSLSFSGFKALQLHLKKS